MVAEHLQAQCHILCVKPDKDKQHHEQQNCDVNPHGDDGRPTPLLSATCSIVVSEGIILVESVVIVVLAVVVVEVAPLS